MQRWTAMTTAIAVVAVGGCAGYGGAGMRTESRQDCGPGYKGAPACVVVVDVDARGNPVTEPGVLHVHFTPAEQRTTITWRLRDGLEERYHFRRSGIVFLNLAPEAETLGTDVPAHRAESRARDAFPGYPSFTLTNECGSPCVERDFRYRVVLYDAKGDAHITEDPGVHNDPR